MRRASLAVAAVTALCLATTACAGFKGNDQKATESGANVPKAALCPGKTPAKDVKVVTFWTVWNQPQYVKSAQQFNCAHPDIAVNVQVNDTVGDDHNGKLLAAVAAHKGPDLVLSFSDVLSGWAARKRVEPLDKYLNTDGLKTSEFVPAAAQSTQWNGHTYGIPFDWDPDALLWYNKSVFAAAGLDPNKPPTTWAEVQSYAAKIDSIKNGKIARLGFVPWAGWQFNYIQLGHQFGATFEDGSGTSPKIVADSPGMRKLFAYEQQVARRYGGGAKATSFVTVNDAQGAAADPLIVGRVGMEMIGDWEYGSAVAALGKEKAQKTIGVVPMPPPPGGQQFLSHSGFSYMVPAGAKNADAAMQYVAWMQQGENFATHAGEVFGFLPARTATLQQDYLKDPVWKQIIAAENKAGHQMWLPPSPILAQYYNAFDSAHSSVTTLKTTPAAALASVEKQAKAALSAAQSQGVYGG